MQQPNCQSDCFVIQGNYCTYVDPQNNTVGILHLATMFQFALLYWSILAVNKLTLLKAWWW